MGDTGTLFDVMVLLLAAVAVVPFLQRLGIPAVLGYLVAGIIVGPYSPGPVVEMEEARPLAEFGVVFLMFAIGMELPLARLRTMRQYIFGLGLVQVAVTALVLGGAAHLLGLSWRVAAIIGPTLAFSSTAMVLGLLVERNEAITHTGRVGIAVLIFQDLAVVPMLALLPLLKDGAPSVAANLSAGLLKAVVAVGAILVLGRFLVHPAYRYIAATRNGEVVAAANLLLVLAVAWLTAQAGMSMALGAFLAGLLIADSPYRHQMEADLGPFRGLLLGLFFMTVGMSIDLPFVARQAGQVFALTAAVVAIKAGIVIVLAVVFGLGLPAGLRVGLLLAQSGEFGFVVFGRARSLGLLPAELGQSLVAAVALSMMITPLLGWLGRTAAGRLRQRRSEELAQPSPENLHQHVIIAGFGRVGHAIAHILESHGIPYVGLDNDLDRVAAAQAQGILVYYGDAGQMGILRSVGIGAARAVVVTINRPRIVKRTVAQIHHAQPDLLIVARAHDVEQQRALDFAGATAVVPETIEASLQMAGVLLRSSGIGEDEVERSLTHHRRGRYGITPEESEKAE